jgi:excisionase family DNA binding protein
MIMDTKRTGQAELVADGFLGVDRAAEFLGLSKAMVYILMSDGVIPFAKFGRARRIPRKALHDYAAAQLVAPTSH